MTPRVLASLASSLALIAGCRYDVQLHGDRDAAIDVLVAPDVALDAGSDTPDTPAQTCASGIGLLAGRATAADRGATMASSPSAAGMRHGVLVPPSARDDGASTTLLLVLDTEGTVVARRELTLLDALGAPSETATLHSLGSGEGFLLSSERAIEVLDLEGATTSAVPLTAPPSSARQRSAGFVDDVRFVFVSAAPGAPLVVFDRGASTITTTDVTTDAAAVVLVHRGGVTVGVDAPLEVVEYAPSLSGEVTFRSTWPPAPLARHLLGVAITGGRRLWATADGEEFRNAVSIMEIPDAAAPITITSMTLVAPLVTTPEHELLAVAEATGDFAVVDYPSTTIERLGSFGSAAIERGASGYALLSLEGSTLTFRCVP